MTVIAKPNLGDEREMKIAPEKHFRLTQEELARMIADGDFNRNLVSFGEDHPAQPQGADQNDGAAAQ